MRLTDFLKAKRESLGAKILLITTLFIMVMYVSFSFFIVYYQNRVLKEHLLYEGRQLAGLTAHSLRLGVFAENKELLKGPIESILQYKETIYVQVYAPDGKLLQALAKPGREHLIDLINEHPDVRMKAMTEVKGSGSIISIEQSENIDFWAPVVSGDKYTEESLFYDQGPGTGGDIIGYVRIVLTKEEMQKMMREVVKQSIIVPVLFLIAGWIISYFIIRGIISPLKKLMTGVKSLEATGAFEKVPLETNDEIGKLASAFNDMADTLKQREEEKQQLEEQLRHSQKMEAVGTLAGGIAHDFNNILTVIKSYGQMLQKTGLKKEDERRFLDQILSSTHKASALTRGLLTFSRKQTINPHPVNLNLLIADIEDMLRRIIDESIELEVDTTKEDLIVLADKLQMEHVLINLVTNARDAMPEGGRLVISTGTIDVNARYSGAVDARTPGRYALLSISDTGTGMDLQTKERIFDPFFTTKDVGKGTGLGMSIVYGIINQHKGYIDVRSEPGKGTAFDILLPLDESAPEEERTEGMHEVKGGTETILLAEDDSDVRTLITDILTLAGYTVIAAGDGDEAVEKFIQNKDRIDLLLLDVKMPKKNGKVVYKEISRMAPGTKVLFMSGYAAEDTEKREGISDKPLLPEEGTELLFKPLVPDEILGRIREMLDKHSE
ncbi:MAG: response regulator [Nitrospirae bacterium]|nr:response regulator [Nitrospirota bacterium]